MTVRKYYATYGSTLCDFGPEGNHLRIRPTRAGVDLVDDGCNDTGTDSSNRNIVEAVNEWLRAVEAGHLQISSELNLPVYWRDCEDLT